MGPSAIASVGTLDVLPSEDLDADAVAERMDELTQQARVRGRPGRGQARQPRLRRQRAGRGRRRGAREARALPGRARRAGLDRPDDAVRALDPERYLADLEPVGWSFGLERMVRLCTELGEPQRRFESLHVVGTNGKSSVTTMTAALLAGTGRSTRRLPLAARLALERADADRRRRDRGGGVRRRRRGGRRRDPGGRGPTARRSRGRAGDPVRGRDRRLLRRLRPGRGGRRRDRGRARRPPRRDQRDPLAGDRADLGRPRPHRPARRDRGRDRRREARRPPAGVDARDRRSLARGRASRPAPTPPSSGPR